MQESSKSLPMGAVPRSICVLLQDDLADCCQTGGEHTAHPCQLLSASLPGYNMFVHVLLCAVRCGMPNAIMYQTTGSCCTADDIEVTGVLTRHWLCTMPGLRCNTDVLMVANYVHKQPRLTQLLEPNEQFAKFFCSHWDSHADSPLNGRNQILAGICPQLYGLCMVKLALMLMLIGGEPRLDETGGRVRAELHLLLVGDPGTGKFLGHRHDVHTVATLPAQN